ncbi:MAG: TonB family protein [Gammaproteobacteria bacterium]|nr:TonB family protein [Gammaproteobacteria bacterium]
MIPDPDHQPAVPTTRRRRTALVLACALHCAASPLPASEPAGPMAAPAAAKPVDETAALATRREAAQQTFLRLSDEQRFEEARDIAAQIVDLTARLHGAGSIEMATPLTNLATTQVTLDDLAGAQGNYQAAIDIVVRTQGATSPRLVNPLIGLGETFVRAGNYEQARDAYRRALRITHIDAGFYNTEQLRIMDGLSEAYLGLDKLDQATAQQRTQVAIQRRRSGPDSEDLAAALHKLGQWYNRTGQYVEAHGAFQAERRIVRQLHGDTDPAGVDALIGEAMSYANEGAVPASASTLKRALDILDQQPERDHRKRAEVLIALGDLYILNNQPRAAGQRYGQAWQDLSGNAALETERDNIFGQAVRIAGPRLPDVVGPDGRARTATATGSMALPQGMVLAECTVEPDGDARDCRIVESQPPGLLDDQVRRALGSTRFRPRLVDGVPVTTAGVQFRHEFRHVPAGKAPEAAGEPEPDARDPAGEAGERIEYPEPAAADEAADAPDGSSP